MSWEAERAMDYTGGWAEGRVGSGVQTTGSRLSVPQAGPGLVSASGHQSAVTRKQTAGPWPPGCSASGCRGRDSSQAQERGHCPSGDLGTSPPAIGHSALKSSLSSAPKKCDRRMPGSRTRVRKRSLLSSLLQRARRARNHWWELPLSHRRRPFRGAGGFPCPLTWT